MVKILEAPPASVLRNYYFFDVGGLPNTAVHALTFLRLRTLPGGVQGYGTPVPQMWVNLSTEERRRNFEDAVAWNVEAVARGIADMLSKPRYGKLPIMRVSEHDMCMVHAAYLRLPEEFRNGGLLRVNIQGMGQVVMTMTTFVGLQRSMPADWLR